ncbi:MAG: SMC-Scp complex subunit ScpB [Candidatus Rokubacteria bacterium]|nr:SMC-Scp complex subunit ScpB [Candidatus Rokubacteria bacterium]
MPQPIDVVEALLFASDTPVEVERIQEVLDLGSEAEARALLEDLRARYDAEERGLQIVEVGGGFRMVTRPEVAPWLVRLAKSRTRSRLSRSALEALAIVAYRQPVSRPEIDVVRGVNSDAVLESLLDRRLIRIAGRKDAPGRPFLYETTREFLVAFGLRDLTELPQVEGDLPQPAPTPEGQAPGVTASGETAQQDPGRSGAGLAPGE